MSMSKRFTCYGVQVGNAVVPITDQSARYGVELYREGFSSQGVDVAVGVNRVRPSLSLTSNAINQVIAAMLPTDPIGKGLARELDGDTPGIFYFREMVPMGRSSTSERRTVNSGLICLNKLDSGDTDSNQGATATIDLYTAGQSDGSGANAPVYIETGQTVDLTLPSGAEAVFFAGGPVLLNGTEIPTQRWTLDFNPQIIQSGESGKPFDTFVGLTGVQPMLTVTTKKMDLASVVGLFGKSVTTVAAYLKKKVPEGARVGNSSAVHRKFLMTAGVATLGQESASHNAEGSLEIQIPIAYDGTNNIVQFLVSAIGA